MPDRRVEVAYYRVDGALVLDVVAPVGTQVRVFVNGHPSGIRAQEPDPEQ